jgi:hypothetical protein
MLKDKRAKRKAQRAKGKAQRAEGKGQRARRKKPILSSLFADISIG